MDADFAGPDPITNNWRTDKKNERTIYVTTENGPRDTDPMIGTMDNKELVENVVEAHNLLLVRTDLAETAADLEAKAAFLAYCVERLETADKFIDWLLEMNDPTNPAGRTRRQRINLAWIFEEAEVVKATRSDQVNLT